MAQASWIMPQGSFMANRKFAARARGLGDPAAIFLLAMSLEPRALRREPCAVSREPLNINNRFVNELFDD